MTENKINAASFSLNDQKHEPNDIIETSRLKKAAWQTQKTSDACTSSSHSFQMRWDMIQFA